MTLDSRNRPGDTPHGLMGICGGCRSLPTPSSSQPAAIQGSDDCDLLSLDDVVEPPQQPRPRPKSLIDEVADSMHGDSDEEISIDNPSA